MICPLITINRCEIPDLLGIEIEYLECKYKDKYEECPIMKFVIGYAEDYHSDACTDCENNLDEDPIMEAMRDAYD